MKIQSDILDIKSIIDKLDDYKLDDKIVFINAVKQLLHKKSPFANEPVDCVIWVKSDSVIARSIPSAPQNLDDRPRVLRASGQLCGP